MENKTIDMNRFKEYTEMMDASGCHTGSFDMTTIISTTKREADDAIIFLKHRRNDSSFDFKMAKSSILSAMQILKDYEVLTREAHNLRAKQRAEERSLKKLANENTEKVMNKKIEPLFDEMIKELENMKSIDGFEDHMGSEKRRKLFLKLKEVI